MMARLLALLLLLCGSAARAEIKWEVVRTLPHDPDAFTQGLFIADGLLYESTGLVGQSDFRAMNLKDGKILRRAKLDRPYFGEGSTGWRDTIISLTWQHGKGFRWDRETFRKLGEFSYPGEGWGLTQDGESLILSDGTSALRFLDPRTFAERRRVRVTWRGQPIGQINELEYVRGEVLANIWHSGLIVRIDPASGAIKGVIDLRAIAAAVAIQSSSFNSSIETSSGLPTLTAA